MNRRKKLKPIQYEQYQDMRHDLIWPKDMMRRLISRLAESPLGRGYMDFPILDIKPTKLAFSDSTCRALRHIAMRSGSSIICATQKNPEESITSVLDMETIERLKLRIVSPAQKALMDRPIEPIAIGRLW